MSDDDLDEIRDILLSSNVQIRFGLEQQGHLPLIEKMLDSNHDWGSINKAIGWAGDAACEHYIRIVRRKIKEISVLTKSDPNFDNEINLIGEMLDRHCCWAEINSKLGKTGNALRDNYLVTIRHYYKQISGTALNQIFT